MSFQGDVGGIGLGELLQSLARGTREGVLVLVARDGLTSTLGIKNGLLQLLPNEGEDGEVWRERARAAWAKHPDTAVDMLRISAIARAERIETLYRLLDSEGVHFRFDTGEVPGRSTDSVALQGQARAPQVFCEASAVEPLLLEFARIQDESLGAPLAYLPSDNAVPRLLDRGTPPKDAKRLFQECDGASSIREIADRMGAPRRTVRLQVANQFKTGNLRFAQSHELLALFEKELSQGSATRAGGRISAWCEFACPGPMSVGEAQLLMQEWASTRLVSVVAAMRPRDARALMRRLDHTVRDIYDASCRWEELRRLFPKDVIVETRWLKLQHLDTGEPALPKIRDLLENARRLRDGGHPKRSGAVLRLAAARLPNGVGERLELGHAMLASGLFDEGLPWITEAAKTLIEQGSADKAIAPLRAAVECDPTNRSLRRMLSQARARSAAGRRMRRNALIASALVVMLAAGAFVKVRGEQRRRARVDEILATIARPAEASTLLESYFPDADDPEINGLRERIRETQRTEEEAASSAWLEAYRDAHIEATIGDPLLGLQRAVALTAPPRLTIVENSFPLVSDVFSSIAARLEAEIDALGATREQDQGQIRTEQRQSSLLAELLAHAASVEPKSEDLDELSARLASLAERIEGRVEERRRLIDERIAAQRIANQDMLLAAARAHAKAGDWSRSLEKYELLVATEDGEKLGRALREEIERVRSWDDALRRAREMAEGGRHDRARGLLDEAFEGDLSRYSLPWQLDSAPSGARVRFPDGTVRSTPLRLESAFGERLALVIEHERYEPRPLEVDAPGDRFVQLSLVPSRRWRSDARIETVPVPIPDGGHLVCDRRGQIARLDPAGEVAWSARVETLGGIARAPLFLPQVADTVLVLTEDGEAWTVALADGERRGPWSAGVPPLEGPLPALNGACARFPDDRYLLWEERLKPRSISRDEGELMLGRKSPAELRHGSASGMHVLRRAYAQGELELASPWSDWSVTIDGDLYIASRGGKVQFQVRRSGEWEFVAFEAPRGPALPRGRMWVADGEGLRAFDL